MSKSKEQTDSDHIKILGVYESIVKEAGVYAPYLSKEYYYENTIHICKHKGLSVSKTTIWRALKNQTELKKKKPFIEDDNEG